jgi:hypothetical protein
MNQEWYFYLLSVVVSFLGVFLKVFQQKSVIGNHTRSMFLTSYLMAMFDVASIAIIIKGGWIVALTSGTGAALAMVTSVKIHNKIFATKGNAQ